MNTRNFEKKIYDKNKKVWHANHFGELHHGCRRVGVRLCCPALWVAGKEGHENDFKWVAEIRETLRNTEREVLENYCKGFGCRDAIYKTCLDCAMPRFDGFINLIKKGDKKLGKCQCEVCTQKITREKEKK